MYHGLSWPQLSYVAEDDKGKIVGYVLAKVLKMFLSYSGKGRHQKKIDFFLGKSPKLWVGGGQES